jgi:hypothetical protein
MGASKQDYELIANTLKECAGAMTPKAYKSCCIRFALRFALKYPAFNETKFLEACKLTDGGN